VFAAVALVLLLVLPSPWDIVGFGVGLACFGGEVVFWNRRVRGHRVAVGAQGLIGEVGTVLAACRPIGQVRVMGETWAAQCDAGADPGDAVEIVGRRGLTLMIERSRH
jgi:membrane protein implicated in regulation of membrane protease activity